MKKLVLLAVIALVVLLAGCSSVQRIGSVGIHDFYAVSTCDTISPCTTTVLTYNTQDGALNKIEGGTGPSVLGQFLGPASVAAAGYFIGEGIADSGDDTSTVNNENVQVEGSRAGAISGSASGSVAVSKSASVAAAKAGARSGAVGIGVKK